MFLQSCSSLPPQIKPNPQKRNDGQTCVTGLSTTSLASGTMFVSIPAQAGEEGKKGNSYPKRKDGEPELTQI